MGLELEDVRPDPGAPASPAGPPAAAPGLRRGPRAPRTRGVIAWILVVVVSILVPLSVITVWAVRTLGNTDHYVATMAPLAKETVVTDYMALQATNQLFTKVQVQSRIESALPKRAAFVAAPITAQLHSFVQTQTTRLLRSEWFANFWTTANRRIHGTLIKFLKGEPLPRVQSAQKVAISLTPVVDKAVTELDKRGVTVFDNLRATLDKGAQADFSLANQAQVKKIRTAFRYASDIGWALPLVALVLLVAAVAVAVRRRKTFLRAAVGSALAILVVMAALALGRQIFINQAGHVPGDVTGTVFDTVTRFLRHSMLVTLLVAVLVAIVAWLAGPGRWPVWIRVHVWGGLCWIGRQVRGLFTSERRATVSRRGRAAAGWCLEHRSALRLAGIVVAGLVIVFGTALSVASVWTTLLVLAIYLVLLEVVLAWARRNVGAVPAVAEGRAGDGDTHGPTQPDRDRDPRSSGVAPPS